MVFQTQNDVLCFAASGTGGMESAVANLVRPGEPVLVASCGKFGERWTELAEAFGAPVVHHDAGWGNRVEPGDDRDTRTDDSSSGSSGSGSSGSGRSGGSDDTQPDDHGGHGGDD